MKSKLFISVIFLGCIGFVAACGGGTRRGIIHLGGKPTDFSKKAVSKLKTTLIDEDAKKECLNFAAIYENLTKVEGKVRSYITDVRVLKEDAEPGVDIDIEKNNFAQKSLFLKTFKALGQKQFFNYNEAKDIGDSLPYTKITQTDCKTLKITETDTKKTTTYEIDPEHQSKYHLLLKSSAGDVVLVKKTSANRIGVTTFADISLSTKCGSAEEKVFTSQVERSFSWSYEENEVVVSANMGRLFTEMTDLPDSYFKNASKAKDTESELARTQTDLESYLLLLEDLESVKEVSCK